MISNKNWGGCWFFTMLFSYQIWHLFLFSPSILLSYFVWHFLLKFYSISSRKIIIYCWVILCWEPKDQWNKWEVTWSRHLKTILWAIRIFLIITHGGMRESSHPCIIRVCRLGVSFSVAAISFQAAIARATMPLLLLIIWGIRSIRSLDQGYKAKYHPQLRIVTQHLYDQVWYSYHNSRVVIPLISFCCFFF